MKKLLNLALILGIALGSQACAKYEYAKGKDGFDCIKRTGDYVGGGHYEEIIAKLIKEKQAKKTCEYNENNKIIETSKKYEKVDPEYGNELIKYCEDKFKRIDKIRNEKADLEVVPESILTIH